MIFFFYIVLVTLMLFNLYENMMSFFNLLLRSQTIDTTAKAIPVTSEPIMRPKKQAIDFGEQMLAEKRLEKEGIVDK